VIAGIAVTHLEAQDIRSLVVPVNYRGEKSGTDEPDFKIILQHPLLQRSNHPKYLANLPVGAPRFRRGRAHYRSQSGKPYEAEAHELKRGETERCTTSLC
jgi:hypothetical protein